MSVVVMGMDMPDQGWRCELNNVGVCKEKSNVLSCGKFISSRCPLRPLPEKHGRLIDESWIKKSLSITLESLKKHPQMDGYEMHLIAAFEILMLMLDKAPTIVEAEGD